MLLTVGLPVALAFIMLSLGLALEWRDFARIGKQPLAFFVAATNQVIVLPIAGLIIIAMFGLEAEIAIGVMILALCPGGVTSNVVTRLAKGDVALSVSVTAIVSLLSILTVPLLLTWAVSHFASQQLGNISIAGLAVTMFLLTTVPVILGIFARQIMPDLVAHIEPFATKIAVAIFFVVVIAAIVTNQSLVAEQMVLLGPALILFNVAVLLIGYFSAKAFGLGVLQRKTVAIESGIQNGTLGIALATIIAGSAKSEIGFLAIPSALYGIVMYLTSIPAVLWLRNLK